MKKYKIAAILMIIHGGFMEIGGILAMIPALMFGTDKFDIGKYFEFKFVIVFGSLPKKKRMCYIRKIWCMTDSVPYFTLKRIRQNGMCIVSKTMILD